MTTIAAAKAPPVHGAKQKAPAEPAFRPRVTTRLPSNQALLRLQRMCACWGPPGSDGACEACRQNDLGLQRSAAGRPAPATAPPTVHEVLRSPGQSLDPATRTTFEAHVGHAFGEVRIHTDSRAAASARALNALAYTVGPHIVFGANKCRPGTSAGDRLLAHELAHVIQQSLGLNTNRFGDSQSEGEAEAAANSFARGERANIQVARAVGIARQNASDENPANCKVEVLATNAGSTARLLGLKHLFIVATSARGTRTAYRAGPSIPVIFGPITEDHGVYDDTFPDWDPAAPAVTVGSGASACEKEDCLTEELIRIDHAKVWYLPLGPNSNTVVSVLLTKCGLSRLKPNVVAPGWDAALTPSPRPSPLPLGSGVEGGAPW
jgi:hypothetical protein